MSGLRMAKASKAEMDGMIEAIETGGKFGGKIEAEKLKDPKCVDCGATLTGFYNHTRSFFYCRCGSRYI